MRAFALRFARVILLPSDLRFSIEFRHTSWLVDAVYDALKKQNVSLCVAESDRLEIPQVITADFVYYRLRKPEYSEEERHSIARTQQPQWGHRYAAISAATIWCSSRPSRPFS